MACEIMEDYINEAVKINTIELARIAYNAGVAPYAVKNMFIIGLKCSEADAENMFKQYITEDDDGELNV